MTTRSQSTKLAATSTLRGFALAAGLTAVMTTGMGVIGGEATSPAGITGASLILLAAPAYLAAACAYLLVRSEGAERGLWRAVTHASIALLVGEACDVALRVELAVSQNLLLMIQVVAFIVAAIFGGLAARRLIGSPDEAAPSVVGSWLDILVMFLGVFTLMLATSLPVLVSADLSYGQALTLALLPSLSVGLVLYVVIFKKTAWSGWQVLGTACVAFISMNALVAAFAPRAGGPYTPGSAETLAVDAVLIFGYVLGVSAVMERLRLDDPPRYLPLGQPARMRSALAAPAVLIAFAPLVYASLTNSVWRQQDVWVVVTCATFIGLASTARSHMIASENSSLRQRSTVDPLTGLANHRQFRERLRSEGERVRRAGGTLTVVAIDVDNFDRVNNVYGHAAGDKRLISIAERLTLASRETDIACRVGGDEFAIIMPETEPLAAYKLCLRLQDHLHLADDVCPLPISLSMGIASIPIHAANVDDVVHRADGALYWAKFHGREQIVIYDEKLVGGLGPEERIARLEEESYLNMVQMLSSAVDARDAYTHHHSQRVAKMAVALAQRLGLPDDEAALIETAALLHDVGKIGVPDAVLRKHGQLDDAERALVNEHPLLAVRILGAIPRQEILPWIASHHERWDGTGYPLGLIGEQIPLHSRIIAVCDSYDAMTTERPYRSARTWAEAIDEVEARAGTQFDPRIARAFVDMLQSEGADVTQPTSDVMSV